MTTWILDADRTHARIFQQSSPESEATLYQEISASTPRLLRRTAHELNLACGAGTESRLVIYGEEPMLARLLPLLGVDAKDRLVGAFSRQSISYPGLGAL